MSGYPHDEARGCGLMLVVLAFVLLIATVIVAGIAFVLGQVDVAIGAVA